MTVFFFQNTQYCQLIPFELLFPNLTQSFKQFFLDTTNYPVAIFLGSYQKFALVKVFAEKVKNNSTSSDPSEFRGFISSQTYNKYLQFTLIRLDKKHLKIIGEFNKSQNWKNQYKYFQKEFLDNPINFKQDKGLVLTNNLFLENNKINYPLLNQPISEFNLAFSLVNKLLNLQNEVKTEIEMTVESRTPHKNFNEIILFEDSLKNAFISLLSHTANNYQNAYVNKDFSYVQLDSTQNKSWTNTELNNEPNTTENSERITTPTLYLVIFVIFVIGLLYRVF